MCVFAFSNIPDGPFQRFNCIIDLPEKKNHKKPITFSVPDMLVTLYRCYLCHDRVDN